MDPLPSTWSSSYPQMEDTACFINHPWEKFSINQPARNYSPLFFNPDDSSVSEASGTTFGLCSSVQGTSFKKPSSSTPISNQVISFESSNSTNRRSPYQHAGKANFTVKTEAEMSQMISFQSMDFCSSPTSSLQELNCHQFGSVNHEQPSKIARTPLQARYHVLAERKRREKLSQRFMALSALVPGLKKLDKTSVIDGAINHLKHLEERLKVLEEGTKMRDEDSVLAAENKPCLCYHYEEDSPPLKKMEVRILKGDVLIKVNCENQTGFTEEKFVSEMKKLDLSVTKRRFMPFGDNMLAISAVAQMNNELCMAEEELANSIRLAILKLIKRKKMHVYYHSEERK